MDDYKEAKVYVIDDDQAVRDSLRWLIESVGIGVETFENAQAFINHIGPDSVGCAVVDIRLPGMSGLDLQEHLNREAPMLKTVVISGHADVPVAVRAMKAGAIDFIEKPFSDQALLDRIQQALQAQHREQSLQVFCSDVKQKISQLTPREREVMGLVVRGHLNKQIAAELGLSHKTIEVHRANVMDKMQADSLADLVRMSVAVESETATVQAST